MLKVYWNGFGFYYLLEYRKVVELVNEDFFDKWKDGKLFD